MKKTKSKPELLPLATWIKGYAVQVANLSILLGSIKTLQTIENIIKTFDSVSSCGGRIFTIGNGGSALTASHLAMDLNKGANSIALSNKFNCICLADSISQITAWANDTDFKHIFEYQLVHHGLSNRDILFAMSASGESPNIVQALKFAKEQRDANTILLTGSDRNASAVTFAKQTMFVNNCTHTGRIEDIHLIVCHMIAYAFISTSKRNPLFQHTNPEPQPAAF